MLGNTDINILGDLVVRMGGVMRLAVSTGGGAAEDYSMMVFTGWDYGLQGDRATKLKRNNIRYQLKVHTMQDCLRRHCTSHRTYSSLCHSATRT